MKSQNTFFIVLLFIILSGCSKNPKETVVPRKIDDWENNEQLISAVKILTEEEQKLFASYSMRILMGEAFGNNGFPINMTIGDAIENEQKWQEEQKREETRRKELAIKLEKERLAQLKKFNDALTVSVLSIEFRDSDYNNGRFSEDFLIRIGFENHSNKDLIGVKGITVIKDIFGDVIKRVRLSNDDDIKAGQTYVWVGTLDYNQFMDEDNKLRTTSFNKLKIEWEPEIYLYSDGSELRMP